MAGKLIHGLLDLFFPPRCIFCRSLLQKGEHAICTKCKSALPFASEAEAVQSGGSFSKCVSTFLYEGDVRASFLRYKFSGRTNYAGAYGKIMAETVRKYLPDSYDLITWVPLSAKRLKKRGYDQAMLLAMSVALELDDVAVETLRKVEDRPAQSGLVGSQARRDNVKGVYQVSVPELVYQKRILLIDDIITTGSTLSECAQELKFAGAKDVVCVTFARAVLDREASLQTE